ncbi:MAG: PAS domain S-box protein [Halothiobacillaceae bacterium]
MQPALISRKVFVALLGLAFLGTSGFSPVFAQSDAPSFVIGVFAHEETGRVNERFKPLIPVLEQALPEHKVELQALSYPALESALAQGHIDLLITNPSHYVSRRLTGSLGGPIATLAGEAEAQTGGRLGGVVLARSDEPGRLAVSDLTDLVIALPRIESLGGFQAQAWRLYQETGQRLGADSENLLLTGMPHFRALEAVLAGEADVAFVRSGVWEQAVAEGHIPEDALRIAMPRRHPGFELGVSTALYPEWPVVLGPNVPDEVAARVVPALYSAFVGRPDSNLAMVPPAQYEIIETVIRDLRLPPYDAMPDIEPGDLWARFGFWLILLPVASASLLVAGLLLVFFNRRLFRVNQQFARLIERMPEPILVLERDRYIDANPAALRLLGLDSVEQLRASRPVDISPPTQAGGTPTGKLVGQYIERALAGETVHADWLHLNAAGEEVSVELTLLRLGRGAPGRLLAVLHDVTARRRMEQALELGRQRDRDHAQWLKALFDASPIALMVHDAQTGELLEANPAAWQSYGYESFEELRAGDLWMDPPYSEREAMENIRAAARGKPVAMLWKSRRRDGSAFWEQVHLDAVEVAGSLRVIATCMDVTAQVDAENRLRHEKERVQGILYGTGVGTWEWNVQTGEVVFNRRWAEILGYRLEELEPVSIRTWERLAHPDDLAASEQALEKHFSGQATHYELESRMRHKDGSWIWVLDRGRVVEWDNQGRPLRMSGTHQDITERKRLEQALRERENLFRTLFRNLPDGILLIDPDTRRPVQFNMAACRMLGYDEAEFARLTLADIDTRESADEMSARIARLREGSEESFQARHRHRDGHTIPVQVTVRRVEIDGHLFMLAVFRDLTQLSEAQKAYRELLGRFEKLAQLLPGVIYQYQLLPDGRACFPYASEGVRQIYGVEPAAIAEDAGPVFEVLLDEDSERVSASITESARHLTVWHDRYRVQHPERGLIWVEGHATPERLEDGSVLWHGYIFDITERKQIEDELEASEQRFRQFAEVIDLVFWIRTADRMEYISPGYERIWGRSVDSLYSDPNSFVGAILPEDRPRVIEAMQRENSGGENFDETYRIRRPDGRIRWVHAHSFALPGGDCPRFTGIATDITEQVEASQALESATEELRRSNEELEQFAYVASHDLRQPLRMVGSYVQLLERRLGDRLDDESRQMMDFVTDGARRMDQMLQSLLEYSRVGRMGEPKTALDTRQVLDEALHFLEPEIEESGAVLEVRGDWPRVEASRNELVRLFQNLVGNAIKYHEPDQAPQVTISAARDGGADWRFCVRDEGIGIEPDQVGRLFQMFQRLQTRSRYEGFGVGLAVSRKIVEHHGGRIWAESAGLGQGSRFCFILPVVDPADSSGEKGA